MLGFSLILKPHRKEKTSTNNGHNRTDDNMHKTKTMKRFFDQDFVPSDSEFGVVFLFWCKGINIGENGWNYTNEGTAH